MQTKKVLIIAFYFPPSSGAAVQRTLKAVEYLPDFGWEPIVLTAKPSAYDALEDSQSIPACVADKTYRTPAWDVYRHLSIKGKHFAWMASIDRWSTWIPGAIREGKRLIKEHKPDLILSTTPIPSANVIASRLAKASNIPWVADYQDPFGYHHYPTPKLKTIALKKIDLSTMKRAKAAIFATDNTKDTYQSAFQTVANCQFYTVENGFDETNWQKLSQHKPGTQSPFSDNKFSLFYSGVLYPNGRDPLPLFKALQQLKASGNISSDTFELVFQGSGDGVNFKAQLLELGINDLVRFAPSVPYLDSLYYMQQAQALVLIQDAVFNLQVPGKLYEYMRTGRPVLTMTPDTSATAHVARHYPGSKISYTPEAIAKTLTHWITDLPASYPGESMQQFSRREKTREMATIFNTAIGKETV